MSRETARGIVLILFLVLVILPFALGLLVYLSNFPNNSTEEGINLLLEGIVPWWAGIAVAAPVVFVLIAIALVAIDADDVL